MRFQVSYRKEDGTGLRGFSARREYYYTDITLQIITVSILPRKSKVTIIIWLCIFIPIFYYGFSKT